MGKHSIYSPSSFSRWSRCPASAQLCQDIESEDTPASLRGTWMHDVAERVVAGRLGTYDTTSEWNTEENMSDIMFATDTVNRRIENMSLITPPHAELELNVSLVGMGDSYADVFGTADVVLTDNLMKELVVIDYKFGRHPVPAEDNGQLMIYALAAGLDAPFIPETVEMSIIQPMVKDPVKVVRMHWNDLVAWGFEVGKVALDKAKSGNPAVIPGEEQCRFCPLSGDCQAQTDELRSVFDEFNEITPESDSFAGVLAEVTRIEAWIKALRIQGIRKLEQGKTVEGFKLVRKTTKRKWLDDDKAEKWLAARKLSVEDRRKVSVITIAQAEKKLKAILKDNPRLQTNFGKLIHKPQGGITIAPVTDAREAVVMGDPFKDIPL